MKKILSLTLLLMFALYVDAQEVRRLWDFSKGFSEATVANLASDETNWTPMSDSNAKWYESKNSEEARQAICTVNGEEWIIPETEGLIFGGFKSAKHVNLVYDDSRFGAYIWLNGKKTEDHIIIPQVPAGETITLTYGTHMAGNKRGFKVSTSGVVSAEDMTTTTFETDEEGFHEVVLVNNNDYDTDVKLTTTNGMHFQYIRVGAEVVEDKENKIAYLYDSSFSGYDLEADQNRQLILAGLSNYIDDADVVDIDITNTEMSLDSLLTYNAVIVSNAINPASAYVYTIKAAIAYVPMLNLSTSLYGTWGYGTAVQAENGIVVIGKNAMASPFFTEDGETPMFDEETGELSIYATAPIVGYTAEEGTYFANDSIWAKAGDINAIQVHNEGRNTYMMLPTVFGVADDEAGFELETMLPNAVSILYNTKKELQNTAKPSIVSTYHHLSTTVELKGITTGSVIYYTTDGTEPTEQSTRYTEPFEISTTGVTVKAIAKADGYWLSDISEATIEIHELAKSPSIEVQQYDGYTEVTLVPANDGDVMYYNITGSNKTTASSLYEEGSPITLTKHATITAFTAEQGSYLQSEIVSKDITVQNEKVRMDVVSHMNAAKDDWAPAGANPTYFNTKSGHAYYSDNETGSDEEGNPTYAPANEIVNVNPLKGWEVNTYAQVIFWQNNSATQNVNDENGYNPERALDVNTEITNGCISFGGVGAANSNGVTGPNFTASIQSTEAFQGPFDLVSYISTTGSGAVDVFAYVTTDTLNGEWTELGKLETGTVKRLWRQTVLGYEGTDKVFVKVCGKSGACVFDLFIKNQGELSDEYLSGIQDVTTGAAAAGEVVRTMIYSINGTQLDKAGKGINIVKEVYANGAVKTKKIMVK